MMDDISKTDPEVYALLKKELERQQHGLEMIPSENNVSKAVLQAMGSVFTNKYSEGYAKKRYYGGNQFVDEVELLAIERAKKVFNVAHANVQPYSGSPANFAVYMAVCQPNDTIMGLHLPDGGHLTHGFKASCTGQLFNSIPYHVRKDGYIDLEEVERLAMEHKPKLMWVGYTAYVREFPFEKMARIADKVGAYLAADIAHISGLVASGVHKSPSPYAHIVTTTTHKTFRGPRGGIIMVTQKGLDKDPELANKIDKAVFPGLQGGPHDHTTAAIAVALKEMMQPEFKTYCEQIVENSRALAKSLMGSGMEVVTGGSDNHMVLVSLTKFGKGKGIFAQEALDEANITMNKNTIPGDPSSPFYPSGVRMGTPSLTTRGMKEKEMELVGKWIADVIKEIKDFELPEDKKEIGNYLKAFKEEIKENKKILEIRNSVIKLCRKFPLYPGFDVLR
ncbi:serine hydroxymethyltransferase [Candidatus Woesearchaeota archaeon]|nr:serine hydroxymethyltransferase [Candidatus Woesearchaeota archaeon]